jgi:uncharacterized membrane protein
VAGVFFVRRHLEESRALKTNWKNLLAIVLVLVLVRVLWMPKKDKRLLLILFIMPVTATVLMAKDMVACCISFHFHASKTRVLVGNDTCKGCF